MDFQRTINSDDEVDNFSTSEESSDDDMQPKVKSKSSSEFFSDFSFVGSAKDYHYDTWDSILKYLKKSNPYNIDAKIAEVREEQKRKVNSIECEEVCQDNNGCVDASDMEDNEPPDVLHVREKDIEKKAKEEKRAKQSAKEELSCLEYFEEAPPVDANITFQEMNLSRPLLKAIMSMEYSVPTPIQAASIPVALMGRDICGCAATGTGKTAAFMLPILERLIYKPVDEVRTRVLILLPTRELGIQVFQVSKQLAQYTQIDIVLSVGGLDQHSQEVALRKNPDIVIATPGRLIDHLKNTPNFSLDCIEILVLDEADRMLDEYFAAQMKDIVRQCCPLRQTMLFSATMTEEVKDLAAVSLKNPVKVFVNSNTEVAKQLRQEFIKFRKCTSVDREAVVLYLLEKIFKDHCLVFIPTKILCHRLHILLGLFGLSVGELHGNLKQTQRIQTLRSFTEGKVKILLATDVAARGLDIKGIKTVINFTLPLTYQHYVHRVGRTARAGHCGRAVSIASEEEYKMLKTIKRCSKNALFQRIINNENLEKYRRKVRESEVHIKKILEEEKVAKQLSQVEQACEKAEGLMKHPYDPNIASLSSQVKRDAFIQKKKLAKMGGRKSKRRAKREKRQLSVSDTKEKKAMRDIQVATRAAKRGHRLKRIRGRDPATGKEERSAQTQESGTKRRKKTSFHSELVKVDRKSVKKLRYEAFAAQKEAARKRKRK